MQICLSQKEKALNEVTLTQTAFLYPEKHSTVKSDKKDEKVIK